MTYAQYAQSRDRMRDLRSLSTSETFTLDSAGRVIPTTTFTTTTTTSNGYEMQSMNYTVSSTANSNIHTTDGYLSEIAELSASIKAVNQNIDTINELHNTSLITINEDQLKDNSQKLSVIVKKTSTMNTHIKNRIKCLESSNLSKSKNNDSDIRKVQVAKVKKDFLTCIQKYREVESAFDQKNRQRVERQIRIVKQDVTDEELGAILDSDQPNQIFTNSLLQNNRSGQAKAVLSEVQTRHNDIKQIQKTILELAQLFEDMQMLVEDQGKTVDKIESHAENVETDLEEGVKQLGGAIILAKSTRAKKWCCLIIFLILCIIIAILVWWFAFDHPGV